MKFDPISLLQTLNEAGVRYVLIGGLAATLHGSPLRTNDADICPAADLENAARLSQVLDQIDARLRIVGEPDGVAFPHNPEFLLDKQMWTLVTRYGNFDVAWRPTGTRGFDELDDRAVDYRLGDGLVVRVASLSDIIHSKEAAGRPKDLASLPTLRRLRDLSSQ